MSNLSDSSYKYLFANPEWVRDLILRFIPDAWLHALDYSTLERVHASYVSDDLKQRHDDIVWRVKVGEQWVYLYLLIEFQSSVEKYMALRLLVYQGLLYQDLIKTGDILEDGRLPPILPIVLYNGQPRWTAADDIADLIPTVPGIVGQFKLNAKHLVIDKNAFQARDDSAAEKNLVAAVFQLENAATPQKMLALINSIQDWLQDRPDLRRSLAHWISLGLLRNEEYGIVLPEIHDLLEIQVTLADTVERWAHAYEAKGREEGLEQGLEKGLEKGREEGLEKGIEKGELLALQKLLAKRFGAIPVAITEQIALATRQDLERWFDRAIDASRLEDIFQP